jgi:hypothetical protein
MGTVDTISHNTWPIQGRYFRKRVRVCFHYDSVHTIGGFCVRDDAAAPWQTIFKLDNGHYVLATECQYTVDE